MAHKFLGAASPLVRNIFTNVKMICLADSVIAEGNSISQLGESPLYLRIGCHLQHGTQWVQLSSRWALGSSNYINKSGDFTTVLLPTQMRSIHIIIYLLRRNLPTPPRRKRKETKTAIYMEN